ncbi:PEGA domain-containing protein [Saccharicrinis sp. FJH2]|uniref:PEGA domain-containing protein n=1 Tax=Saccharicrinis sp. FJH65 TaxID=3344659 RepID=UPI0035F36833
MRIYTISLFLFILSGLQFVSAQETGTLIIDSDSSYLPVIINGRETGLFTPYNEEVETGEYAIEIKFSPLFSFRDTVVVTANQVTKVFENQPQTSGNLLISSMPTESSVYIGEKLLGETPLALKGISPGDYRFVVKKENYNDAVVNVSVGNSELAKAFAELTAGYGTISILANPEADIYIDDNFEGTKMYNGRLSTGSHVIEVRKESFDPQVKVIEVEEGKAYREFFQLQQVFGKISITTNPSLAKVYLDGKMVGFSSMILDSVPVGEHTLKLVKDGYLALEKNFDVVKNKTNYIGEELKSGFIVVTEPTKAKIYLDGEYVGLSPKFLVDMEPGNHEIQIEKEDYPVTRKEVTFKKNTADSINVVLEQGFLVSSNPEDAKVYMDGALSGSTPLLLKGLEGKHQFIIKKDDFADETFDIDFAATDTLNYHVNLMAGCKVNVLTNSNDAEIWVGDDMVGTGSVSIPLALGEHTLSFKNSKYYNDFEKTIDVKENGQVEEIELPSKMCSVTIISKPKKGTVLLDSTLKFNSNEKNVLLGGLYSMKLKAKGFKTIEDEITIENADEKFEYLMEPLHYRSKGAAVLLTMIWPGAGRSYLTRGESSAIGGFLFYGLGAGSYFTNEKSMDLSDEAAEAMLQNDYAEHDRLMQESDDYKLYSDIMLYTAVGVWGINMIRTLATPSEKKRYEKLKMTGYYNPRNQTTNIGLVYKF